MGCVEPVAVENLNTILCGKNQFIDVMESILQKYFQKSIFKYYFIFYFQNNFVKYFILLFSKYFFALFYLLFSKYF